MNNGGEEVSFQMKPLADILDEVRSEATTNMPKDVKPLVLSEEQLASFKRDGFLLIRAEDV